MRLPQPIYIKTTPDYNFSAPYPLSPGCGAPCAYKDGRAFWGLVRKQAWMCDALKEPQASFWGSGAAGGAHTHGCARLLIHSLARQAATSISVSSLYGNDSSNRLRTLTERG
jgi:hypothetical protein